MLCSINTNLGYKKTSQREVGLKGSFFSLKYVLNSNVIKVVLKLIDDIHEIKSSSLGIKIVSTLLCFILESIDLAKDDVLDLAYF